MEIGLPPAGVTEMDLPIIAAIDLPLDAAGAYVMRIALDEEPHAEVRLHVRGSAASLGAGMPAVGGMVS